MTDDTQTAHGIDLETREGFTEHAADSPDAVQLTVNTPARVAGDDGGRR